MEAVYACFSIARTLSQSKSRPVTMYSLFEFLDDSLFESILTDPKLSLL